MVQPLEDVLLASFFNYLLKITIYSIYSIQGKKSYKIVPITNLTKMIT
jgi:hypothetical protein